MTVIVEIFLLFHGAVQAITVTTGALMVRTLKLKGRMSNAMLFAQSSHDLGGNNENRQKESET